MGDFNLDIIKCPLDQDASTFLNANSSFGLFPLINSPTRITSTSATLIDNIFTNVLDAHFDCGCICVDITDHLPIFLLTNIQLSKNRQKLPNVNRSLSDKGITSLNFELLNLDWSPVYKSMNVNEAYDTFLSMFIPLLDKHIPFKKKKPHKTRFRKPWITHKLLKHIKRKNKLYKKFLNEKNDSSKSKYNKYRNKVTNLLRHAKKKYYCERLNYSKNDIKGTWSVINNILHKSEKSMPDNFM